jgi:hypothetical protein
MKKYWVVEIYLHVSCPRHQMEETGQLHAPAALCPREEPRKPLDGWDGVKFIAHIKG